MHDKKNIRERNVQRRHLIRLGAMMLVATVLVPGAAALAQAPQANDPFAIVTSIYTRAAAGKGDSGGTFILDSKAAKAKYFSKSLVALWAKADGKTPKGDIGPIDFDLVTNSQDPDLMSFVVKSEKSDSATATISATMTGHHGPREKPSDTVIRYDFVRDGGHWKIDDIHSTANGDPWSVREMLQSSLKN
jgi:hypothetical protein